MNEQKIHLLPLVNVDPDPANPRRNFSADEMGRLITSIKAHGIITPIIVEKVKGGKYQLVDGERRYRASKEVGLKEIPCIVLPEMSDTDRLIHQFNLQEQHQGWSTVEKAVALTRLAESLGISVGEVAILAGINKKTAAEYMGFSRLIAREAFKKEEIPIRYASKINATRTAYKTAYKKQLDQVVEKERYLEFDEMIIARIKSGEIGDYEAVNRIGEIARMDVTKVDELIDKPNSKIHDLHQMTGAAIDKASRNVMYQFRYINEYCRKYGVSKLAKLVPTSQEKDIKVAITNLNELLVGVSKNKKEEE